MEAKLKGGQRNLFVPLAYRVTTANGNSVLCDIHVEELKAELSNVKYTGETFAAELCDRCNPEST